MGTENLSSYLCCWGWERPTAQRGWRYSGLGLGLGQGQRLWGQAWDRGKGLGLGLGMGQELGPGLRPDLNGAEGMSHWGTLVGPFPCTTTGSVS